MGCYVNPTDQSKENWLMKNGEMVFDGEELKGFDFSGPTLPVCLVDNGAFTAAGIAYRKEEFEAFNHPNDLRLRFWFIVPKTALEPWYKD